MDMLYTQKEVLKKLVGANLVTFKKTAFLEAVGRGIIPYEHEKGVKAKLYDFDAVAKAIKEAGLGKPPKPKSTIDNLPDPKQGQTAQEYETTVRELGEKPTLTDANIYKTLYAGKLEKLKYEKETGDLILRSLVEDKAFTVARTIRNKILTIPERLSNELASISDSHQIKELLFKEFGLLLDGFDEKSFL